MTRPMYEKYRPPEPIKAYTGEDLRCKTWDTEAALRMLENNLTDLGTQRYKVAKGWGNLIVYGGTGRAARNWLEYQRIRNALINLEPDETLCVQSGKAVYIAKTYAEAPRVVIANSNLVPWWGANSDHFDYLDNLGLMMYGQMTAGSWIYIGFQGILQGTYSTMHNAGLQAGGKYPNPLEGKFVLSAGLGAMGQAQPLAITMNGGVGLIVEVKEKKIDDLLPGKDKDGKEKEFPKLDEKAENLKDAMERVLKYKRSKTPRSIGLAGNAGETHPKIVEMATKPEYLPDFVTDQTSAHDLKNYIPLEYGMEYQELKDAGSDIGEGDYKDKSVTTMITHMKAMLELKKMGSTLFEYGNGIRAQMEKAGKEKDAPVMKEMQPITDEYGNYFERNGKTVEREQYIYPGFVRQYIRKLFCLGKGPFRWATLSGREEDIVAIDEIVEEEFATDPELKRWIQLAREKGPILFQGLPARVCWVAYGDRAKLGLRINEMVRDGVVKGPIVIGRDHLDCGSVASPTRETEEMLDETDAVADWPLLNFALNTLCGASWVSFHSGGGVGHGLSLHAGMVIVADGTKERDRRLEKVLTVDPGIGIARHVDAGYRTAEEVAEKKGVKIPARMYKYE